MGIRVFILGLVMLSLSFCGQGGKLPISGTGDTGLPPGELSGSDGNIPASLDGVSSGEGTPMLQIKTPMIIIPGT